VTGVQALQELMDVSEDIVSAVLLSSEGEPIAATVGEDEGQAAAEIASAMLAYADALRSQASCERLESVTADGRVFIVRDKDRAVVGATGSDAVAGLVLHDLRTVLRKTRSRTRARASASS
jgi:predicted regulator of Ras-like GTPase activity (Roadblock/LC7/MglB family)